MGSINDRMFDIMGKKKLKIVDLSQRLGMPQNTISTWKIRGNDPPSEYIPDIANYLGISVDYLLNGKDSVCTAEMDITDVKDYVKGIFNMNTGTMMPVLGKVQAGTPVEAIRDIVGEIAVTKEMAQSGEYFALKVKGSSMEPMLYDNFVVIVKRQSDIESGQVGVVIVNGSDATIKKVEKHEEGISLIPINNEFKTQFYSNEKIKSLPVEVIGKVIEFRGVL